MFHPASDVVGENFVDKLVPRDQIAALVPWKRSTWSLYSDWQLRLIGASGVRPCLAGPEIFWGALKNGWRFWASVALEGKGFPYMPQ